ncbi:MAG: DF family (seleno)protein [Actinomycetota bacterium]
MTHQVTLLYFGGCPNWEVARGRVKEALGRLGPGGEIRLQPVETPEEADRLGFRGSPTVLIDGVDPFGDANAPTGLSCRVYKTDRGVEGAPSVDQLVTVLKERK